MIGSLCADLIMNVELAIVGIGILQKLFSNFQSRALTLFTISIRMTEDFFFFLTQNSVQFYKQLCHTRYHRQNENLIINTIVVTKNNHQLSSTE